MRWFSTALMAVLLVACSNDQSVTAPADPGETTSAEETVASPTTTEAFSGTLEVASAASFAFVVLENGTVNVTLVEVGGTLVPPTIMLGLGIGTPSGRGCSSSPTMVQAGAEPQVSVTLAPGRYCVGLSDVGNLLAPATFFITIAHP